MEAAAGNALQLGSGFRTAAGGAQLDPRLLDVLQRAAAGFPLKVEAFSGVAPRATGTRNHPTGRAVDINIYGEDGKPLPNVRNAASFRTYEKFAQSARQIQQELYPELNDAFRWGGYFRGGTPFDQMHFDVSGGGMAYGGWDTGLTESGRRALTGAESIGMASQAHSTSTAYSDADLEKMLGGAPAAAAGEAGGTPPGAPAAAGSGMPVWAIPRRLRTPEQMAPQAAPAASLTDQDLERLLTGGAGPAAATQIPVVPGTPPVVPGTPTAPPAPEDAWWQNVHGDSFGDKLGRLIIGAARGGKDVVDTGAAGLSFVAERGAQGLANIGVLPQSAADNLASSREGMLAADEAGRQAFDSEYADSGMAQVGRIGGQIVGTAPLLGAGGRILGAAGNALVRGAGLAPAAARVGQVVQANPLARLAVVGSRGAAEGAGATGLTSAAYDQPLGNQLLTGAAFGGAAGLAGQALGRFFRGARLPEPVARLADMAMNEYGIPLGRGQLSTSPAMRFLDSVTSRFPFAGGGAAREGRQAAFNRAVAETFGENADRITPAVMSAARARIGQAFDDVAQQVPTIHGDHQLLVDFTNLIQDARQTMTADEWAPLENQIRNISQKFQGSDLDTATYQSLTRRGAPLDRAMQSGNPNMRFYAGQLREALDGALERSAPPAVVESLRTARGQWRSMRTIEDLAEKAPTGDISPALLMGAVRGSTSNMAYGGGGDLADLARIGQQFLKEAPSSGTPERNHLIGLLQHAANVVVPGAGAAGAGYMLAHDASPLMAAIPLLGSGASIVAARSANAWLRGGGNRLVQRSLNGPNPGRSIPQIVLTYGPSLTGNRLLSLPAPQPSP